MAFSVAENKNNIEVSDIFISYGDDFRSSNGMTEKQHNVMNNIMNCRTEWFGYHQDKCDNCGYIESEFNSCRDRHCPKCQAVSRKKWIDARLDDILPVPYYHVVFTLPHLLTDMLGYNKKLIYDLLFSSASQTLLTFGHDPKWLGGEIGFFGVLHTWGQTLWPHPHLHFILPGGALSEDCRWITPRYSGKFLFPVKALSKVFKGKFIAGLKAACASGDLVMPPEMIGSKETVKFESWLNRFAARKWVVYCKSPLKNPEQVVRYIGRYTHRVAIANSRITEVKDGRVIFKYKDYKASRISWETMTLDSAEFIRRFLWHVLPAGFHKIRHFGYLANGRAKTNIAAIKRLLTESCEKNDGKKIEDWQKNCPACEGGKLIPQMVVNRYRRMALTVSSFFKEVHGQYAYDST